MLIRKKNDIYQVLSKEPNIIDYIRELFHRVNKKVVFTAKDSVTAFKWANDNCPFGEPIITTCTIYIHNEVITGKRKPLIFLEDTRYSNSIKEETTFKKVE